MYTCLCIAYLVAGFATDQSAPISVVEMAHANKAAWEAVYVVDIEYEEIAIQTRNGQKHEKKITGHWSKQNDLERLQTVDTIKGVSKDIFLNGKKAYFLIKPYPPLDGVLSICAQRGIEATIAPELPRILVQYGPQYLQYIETFDGTDFLTLSEIVSKWKTRFAKTHKAENGDTLLCIRADYSAQHDGDEYRGSYMDIYVNADKNCLVQKIVRYNTGMATENGRPAPITYSDEVCKYKECGNGVYYPMIMKRTLSNEPGYEYSITFRATKLVVNSSLPKHVFAFQFPEHALVSETLTGGEKWDKYHIWGPDNKPVNTFTHDELTNYLKQKCGDLPKAVEDHAGTVTARTNWLSLVLTAGVFVLIALFSMRQYCRRRNRT